MIYWQVLLHPFMIFLLVLMVGGITVAHLYDRNRNK